MCLIVLLFTQYMEEPIRCVRVRDFMGSVSLELVERAACAAAKEATATGQHVTFSPMHDLVRDGEVEEFLVDEAVWRILKLKNELGLFENLNKDRAKEKEEILPLEKETAGTIALIGPYADSTEMFGAWSCPRQVEQGASGEETPRF